ncbi:class I SAM-dependent methyltransferase [Campylobacter sp. MIT 21-1685]|uniref:class I SAM-dependent methyltransferase n=1 Tax=unclassified Campylobacter TaxID=2593542 RepID=UPI00224ADC04|nr:MULTISPECIES: class I SAM-dependent methyltransferase [unclassified Campylobacter]MCX2683651.1 class I SAM-dependent methyltransferase [Campylobacter sp. MIT 21-1684]MCX2751948.1 class I SAM-dependent methyltransferase [Campylobacter sp. MIT 21-1682]MCX2808149.1 class I SAM-dependent methyltransferase [Campylobacter sp. MIT 21-1685]
MIERFGKSFDNKAVLRTSSWIKTQSKEARKKALQFSKEERKELRACPMCESTELSEFVVVYDFLYCQCQNCENLFLKNPLKDTAKLYTNDGKKSSYEMYLSDEIFERRLKLIAQPKVQFISDVAKKYTQDKQWLDIGSGGGENLFAAKKLGFRVSGFESDSKAVAFANRKLGRDVVREGFLDSTNCDKALLHSIKNANVISFFNVLEHLDNPKETLSFLGKTMRKKSLLAIEVPRHPSLASYANFLAPNRVYRHLIPPFHLNIFSEKALELASRGGGLSCVAKWTYGQGFMDMIHAFKEYEKNGAMYEKISLLSNSIQALIDENGLADFLLIVLQKK